jgi:hypothetical protein
MYRTAFKSDKIEQKLNLFFGNSCKIIKILIYSNIFFISSIRKEAPTGKEWELT